MICKVCLGKGWILNENYTERIECPACHGTKETDPTNEDWFCSISTEKRANFIAKQCADSVADFKVGDMSKWKPENWVKWLKEKHNGNT